MNDIAAAEGHIQTFYYILAIFGLLGSGVVAYARMLHGKIDKSIADLATFKVEVATDYISATRFEAAKLEIMSAINHLGSRIDAAMFHQRPAE
jgi:hypothetical protein